MKPTRSRNLAAATSGLALALSLAVGPVYADQVSATTTTVTSGMAVAGGVVTGVSGAAMPGAVIDLYAWPSDAVLKAMKVGQLVPTTLLASATTNSAGEYMLRVPAARLKAAAVESGYANLEIASVAAGFWFFPYQTDTLPAYPPGPVTANLTSNKHPICGSKNGLSFTGFALLRERQPAWAVVGQGYISPSKKTAGSTVQFNYTMGASQMQASKLGVGVSSYGFDAGYNGAGTSSSTATMSQSYPSQSQSTWFRTQFSVGQFRGLCIWPPPGLHVGGQHLKQHGKCPHTYADPATGTNRVVYKCIWMVKSTGWFASGDVQHPKQIPHTPGKYCTEEPPGQMVKTARAQAIKWSSGYDIGASTGITGVNLKASFSGSAQTGYDTNAQMVFTFKRRGWICGTNKDSGHAALLVVRGTKP